MDKTNIRKSILPIVPLRGQVAFPNTPALFEVGREFTIKALNRASENEEKLVFICAQKDSDKEDIVAEDLYTVGTVACVKQMTRLPGGTYRVLADGGYRARARLVRFGNGFYYAFAEEFLTVHGDPDLEAAYVCTAKDLMNRVFANDDKKLKDPPKDLAAKTAEDPEPFVDFAASIMHISLESKQQILEEESVLERLKLLMRAMNELLDVGKLEKKISATVRGNIEKAQKDYYLREQLKVIHSELGDDTKEADEYREKIKEKGLPEEVEAKCMKELERLDKMTTSSPEYTVITTYLDWVLDLPWNETTTDTEKLADCTASLEADHYGLDKIKERITEYLAVLKLTGNMKAPILCLVGPPGVGKTSVAQSIAKALGRKFVRMSLGGVKDEAEIRGHRRTYVGAMPGRILYAMKNAGTINPVFLLDEIDKISSDMRGDPASALLEALDPEQNSTFRDRFLEVPYDLSKTLFIATANTLETIPAPLRDRMEIIELSGYTIEEKTEIAKRYLVPKQLKANGLTEQNASFTDSAIQFIIEGYTMEAGVRTLERTIGTVCRKIAVRYADDRDMAKVKVDEKKAEELLGVPRFKKDEARKQPEVGAVTGLAWTAVGGTTLTVEASVVHGKGEIRLTGKLGDVMKESALAALSFIRAHADKYGIDPERFETSDIHIHVPEGATPKDGPSAGITIATAILSAFTGKPVRQDIAMTGEITLRGKVLPIGGLKEKSLAARRIGIKDIIIPADNQKDVEEIPEELRKDLHFIPVLGADEVFAIAMSDRQETEKKGDLDGQKRARPKRVTTPKKTPVVPVSDTTEHTDYPATRC
jgi:ATP-dependent Lon protease